MAEYIFFTMMFLFVATFLHQMILSDILKIKANYDMCRKRLEHDSSVDIEDMIKKKEHWKTEFNVHKPDWCFWITLKK
jgi:hypothetical protein